MFFFCISVLAYVLISRTFRYICTHGVSLIGMLSYLYLKSCRSLFGDRDLTLTSRWSCLPCSALRRATMSPLSNTDLQTRPGYSSIVWLIATVQRTFYLILFQYNLSNMILIKLPLLEFYWINWLTILLLNCHLFFCFWWQGVRTGLTSHRCPHALK